MSQTDFHSENTDRQKANGSNALRNEDRAVHDWYRFVLSFPPHLVREYIDRFDIDKKKLVLDPFCGTGTTLVECKKHGIPSIGVEANTMAWFASEVKTEWNVDPDRFFNHAANIANITKEKLEAQGINDNMDLPLFAGDKKKIKNLRALAPEKLCLLLNNSISPIPLHKTMELLDTIEEHKDDNFYRYEKLALARAAVFDISNLHFGPEVGVRSIKTDAPVVSAWLNCINTMAEDMKQMSNMTNTRTIVLNADSRDLPSAIKPGSVDAVITSPPYPNEKDYTRTTRLESVLLGFINTKQELRSLKKNLVRSNTRGVYKGDSDDLLISDHKEIQRIAQDIENRRLELGKTSGFERLYARVAKLYFGGMYKHLAELRKFLRPGAHLAYVVGDQASYLQIMIRTGQILAGIAQSLGYEILDIDLFRTRKATATRSQLREEVVVLRWPGHK